MLYSLFNYYIINPRIIKEFCYNYVPLDNQTPVSIYSVRKSMIPLAKKIVLAANQEEVLDEKKLKAIRNALTKRNGGILPKNLELIQAYRELVEAKKIEPNAGVLKIIQKRKVRTMSGIAARNLRSTR